LKNASLHDPEFLDRSALDGELTRVFEKCHDCRRCLPLCPSFPALFAAIDAHEQEASELTTAERRTVVDLCYQCKLCYNHCPYHPPHEWEIDFPKLMSRAKLVQAREEGIPLPERMGQRQDLLGTLSCRMARVTNPAFRNRAVRLLMEKATGIDRRWPMPAYESVPASAQLGRPGAQPGAENCVVLFGTCFVEYSEAETARAALQVLEHNGCSAVYRYTACCGAPFLHGGDLDSARRNAERVTADLVEWVRKGVPIVVPGPTCSYQLKNEFPALLGSDAARELAANTYDLGEYLWKLRAEGRLKREFSAPLGRVAYHLPCHLKAQNVGFRSRQLLKLAGADVEMFELCSGVDGTWGMKAEWYDESLKIADKLANAIRAAGSERVATDCPLAALRIHERTGLPAVHPIVLLRDAYGLGGSR
jgi:glycerol-3-phosphate dehydrogenase subunit C